jgi:pimeloyl-ACP methyl ester carboxylesterase
MTAEQTEFVSAAPQRNSAGRTPATNTFADRWGARGWVTDLDGPVYWVEFGDDSAVDESQDRQHSLPPIVFVHGLGGSHLNWGLVGSELAGGRRAVALDLRGFGLTPGTGRACSVTANARLLDRFLREVVGEPAVLVGNSMGGMISALQAAGHPETVAGVVLVDPALPAVRRKLDVTVALMFLIYGVPGLGELYLRRSRTRTDAETQVRQVVDLCFADLRRADPHMMAAVAELVQHRDGFSGTEAAFLTAARSLIRLLAAPKKFRAVTAAITAPVLLLHGEKDRLVSCASARKTASANPHWQTCYLDDVGHTPQLEVPERFVEAVSAWLAQQPGLATPIR